MKIFLIIILLAAFCHSKFVDVILDNFDSHTRYVHIYLGESSRKFRVLLDTSFSGLVVQSIKCEQCNGTKYEETDPIRRKKRFFNWKGPVLGHIDNNTVQFSEANQSKHSGLIYQDRICVEEGPDPPCVEKYRFFGSLDPLGLPAGIEGVLGLRPPLNKEASKKYAVGNNLAYSFHRQKMITENMLGFYMTPHRTQLKLKFDALAETAKSQIRFGQVNTELIEDASAENAINWFHSADPDGWAIHITDAWVGKRQIWFNKFAEFDDQRRTQILATINPSHSTISLPQDLFAEVKRSFIEENPILSSTHCSNTICYIKRPCDQIQVPSFRLRLSNSWSNDQAEYQMKHIYVEIPAEALLIPAKDLTSTAYQVNDIQGNKCFLALTGELPAGSDKAILGTAFMQSVYSVLSVQMPEGITKVGFAKATRSLGIIADEGTPIDRLPLISFILAVFVMVVTGIIVALTTKMRQEKRSKKIIRKSKMEDPNFLLNLNSQRQKTASVTFTQPSDTQSQISSSDKGSKNAYNGDGLTRVQSQDFDASQLNESLLSDQKSNFVPFDKY